MLNKTAKNKSQKVRRNAHAWGWGIRAQKNIFLFIFLPDKKIINK
jgi:hypothetical protein